MSYMKKNRFGQLVAVGDTDPWASDDSSSTPATTDSAAATGSVLDSFKNLFGGASNVGTTVGSAGSTVVTGGTPKSPSTVSQVGAGIGAFLKNLGGPPMVPGGVVYPVQKPGMSTGTKLALAGGGALILVLLLTRD